LICGHLGCGRYKAAHAHAHFTATNHLYAMELESQRVWDYAGDGLVVIPI
jgi:BRCA1-associated protein